MFLTKSTDPSHLPLPPGPRLRGLFRMFRQSPPEFMLGLMREYGDVVRFRGFFPVYAVNHPDYVRQILTQAHPKYTKNTIDYRVISTTLGKGLVTNDGESWARQRRLMQPVFSSRTINSFDATINDVTAQLVTQWESKGEFETVWLDRDMGRITFQVVSRTLFGTDIDDVADEMVDILAIINQHPLQFSAFMTLFPWVPLPSNRRFLRIRRRLEEIVDGLVALHREEGSSRQDIVDLLLAARDPQTGHGMSEKQMRDEIITLMLAGHETSSTALTWTFYLLSQHPDIERRLRGELANVLGGRAAMSDDLPRLPYLKQVVQESMRLYPPVWGIARRSAEEVEFSGYRVPRDAYIAITMYALHRHPDYWPEAERFDPDRFAANRTESRHSYCYLPFAAGPRACIGAGMAMLEVQLVLAQLLQRFCARPLAGHPVEPQAVVTLKARHGMPVTIAPWGDRHL